MHVDILNTQNNCTFCFSFGQKSEAEITIMIITIDNLGVAHVLGTPHKLFKMGDIL